MESCDPAKLPLPLLGLSPATKNPQLTQRSRERESYHHKPPRCWTLKISLRSAAETPRRFGRVSAADMLLSSSSTRLSPFGKMLGKVSHRKKLLFSSNGSANLCR